MFNIGSNFNLNSRLYLDSRQIADSLEALQNKTNVLYPPGFEVYCKAEKKWYQNTADEGATPIWTERPVGTGGGNANIDDNNIGTDVTYSNQKIENRLSEVNAEVTNVADDLIDMDTRVSYLEEKQLEGIEVDLTAYQKITDNTLETTNKTVPGAINEINEIMLIAEEQTGDITVGEIPVDGSNNAKDILITDEGGYFTVTNVEGALQEVGSQIKEIGKNKADKSMIGTSLVANTTSEMVDTTKVYVSAEDGNWYYYNGSSWEIGGVYNSQAISNFEIDNIKIKNIDSDKINFEKHSHINEGSYKLAKLVGVDISTSLPIFSTNSDIACVTIDLTNFKFDDLYFRMSEISGQVAVFYTENVKFGNMTFANTINGKDTRFIYDADSQLCKVDVTALRESFSNLVVAMDKNYCDIYSTSKGIIGEKQIKDNSIDKKHIKDKKLLIKTNTMSTRNYFDIDLCENKYSRGYNPGTGLPIWTDNNEKANLYRTITIPIGKNGYIIAKKPMATADNRQCFFLKSDGTIKTNFTTNNLNASTNTYPYALTEYAEVGEDYIKINCNTARSSGAQFLAITYTYEGECTENLVYVNFEGSYIPEWLDTKALLEESEASAIEIVLPYRYCVVEGVQANVYFNNAVRYCDTDKVPMVKMNGKFENYKTFAEYTPSTGDARFDAKLRLYLKNTKDITLDQLIKIQTVPASVGGGATKKVMIIGDSYTAGNAYITKLNELFSNDENMNVEFLGTRGNSPCNHEGRSGWRAYEYVNLATGEYGDKVENPFYNPTTSTFDFSYYMTQQGYASVDYVCINLGTNDIARGHHATTTDMTTAYNQMITSIRAYNPDIKIFIGLPGTRA